MENNALIKLIVGALITITLSIGGALYTSGQTTGESKEKVFQLEGKVAVIESDKKVSENLLYRIDERLKNVEIMIKEIRDRK